jgi:hypothetical protein
MQHQCCDIEQVWHVEKIGLKDDYDGIYKNSSRRVARKNRFHLRNSSIWLLKDFFSD